MLVGFACPLVGVFLVVRRLVFMGVALPQISSTGVAIALSLPLWLGFNLTEHGSHSAHTLAFVGSITFSLAAILVLAFLERRGRGQPEGRLGTAYVVAAALSILLLSKNPYGEIGWLDMLKGEVITISNFDLVLTAATLALVLAVLGTVPQGVAAGLVRPRDGDHTSQERRFLGRVALLPDRADRLDGGAQRRSADRVRISADPGADGASVCTQYAPVHDVGLTDRRRGCVLRFLDRISMGLAGRPDGCRPPRRALRSCMGYRQSPVRRLATNELKTYKRRKNEHIHLFNRDCISFDCQRLLGYTRTCRSKSFTTSISI